jgi:hypothetical protein
MILKFGRVPESGTATQDFKEPLWQYIEKVKNVIRVDDVAKPNERADTNMTYYVDVRDSSNSDGECHSTTLKGQDVCYLMNDEGKTIERIR